MKYTSVLVFLVCALVVNAKPMTKEEKEAMFKPLIEECQKVSGASDKDVSDAMQKQPPASHEAKCLHSCLLEKMGMIQNGKFSQEGAIAATKMATDNNEDMIKTATEIAEECNGVSNDDKCELAVNIMECIMGGAMKRGINLKDMH